MGKGRKKRGGKLGVQDKLGRGQERGASQSLHPLLAPMPHYGREQQAAFAKHGDGHKPTLPEGEGSRTPTRGMSPGSRLGSARQPRSLTPR